MRIERDLPVESSNGYCVIDRYIPGWVVGSGLRIAVAPGRYEVSGSQSHTDGRVFLLLAEGYKVVAGDVKN